MSDELATRWAPTLQGYAEFCQDLLDRAARLEQATAPEDEPFQSGKEAWEDSAAQAADDAGAPRTGVMVAFYPSQEQARQLALDDGEAVDELHLTLVFLGNVGAELAVEDEARLVAAVTSWAATQEPMDAITNGLGVFTEPGPVTYASIDAPALPTARQKLVEALDAAGLPPIRNHGYTPHMTLAYADRRDVDVPSLQMHFTEAVVAFAGTRTRIPLGQPKIASIAAGDEVGGTRVMQEAKAFSTEINGKQLVVAPAVTRAANYGEPTVDEIADQHMLWMDGRFVGAEVPNRNGAFWTAGDLELAHTTVAHGPLNWLHEGRHIIGAIAKADYVAAAPTRAEPAISGGGGWVRTSPTVQPHINATAAIWRWIWPDEAYVVQQASDTGHLWYSMECISREVVCAGEGGCGNSTTYQQYMAGAACEHVRQRASVRHLKDPVFLGGAVIVPPSRPGWAEADARVMDTASGLAEAAYEQAGQPDMPAGEWEQLMAQLIRSAT